MASQGHVLTATDAANQAFYLAAGIEGLEEGHIVRNKEMSGKELPVLICASDTAVRKRAKNWEVTGSLILKSDITDADGNVTEAQLAASTAMETAVLDALEDLIPDDDRPQPLGDAITAAAVAAEAVEATRFMMTGFMINRVSVGFDEDEIWTFSVDYTAIVIA
jgi:hypothetical protein